MSGFQTSQTLPTRSGPGLRVSLARFPTSRGGFFSARSTHMLEGLNLPHRLCQAPAHWRCHHFHRLDNTIGVNDESSAQLNALGFIPYSIGASHIASLIRSHVEGDASIDHLAQLMIIPHLVHKVAVYTNGNHLNAQLLQHRIFIGDRRYFRCSDKGEITWVEA
jgi:hypothetical protein